MPLSSLNGLTIMLKKQMLQLHCNCVGNTCQACQLNDSPSARNLRHVYIIPYLDLLFVNDGSVSPPG